MNAIAEKTLSTKELAEAIKIKPVSIYIRHSRTGSFHGVVPQVTPTRRLIWPADSVARLTKMGRAKLEEPAPEPGEAPAVPTGNGETP